MADDNDFGAPRRRAKPKGDNLLDTRRGRRRSNKVVWIVLAVVACIVVCGAAIPLGIGLLLPSMTKVREAANRTQSSNNLKQIGLAISAYEQTNGGLPRNTYGTDGTPLLSWRVHLLPYIEQENLYEQFKLDEPWDSLNNKPLLDRMPKVYENRRIDLTKHFGKTNYRGFNSVGTAFERKQLVLVKPAKGKDAGAPVVNGPPLRIAQFADGSAQTVLVVEAAEPVEWSKPDDFDIAPSKPFPLLLGNQGPIKETLVLFADFSVKPIRTGQVEATWRALATHSGKDTVPPDFDQ